MQITIRRKQLFLALSPVLILGFLLFNDPFSAPASATVGSQLFGDLTAGGLPEPYATKFPQTNAMGWNPLECEPRPGSSNSSGTSTGLDATGDWSAILNAKNADKSIFNNVGNVPNAKWNDGNTSEMKTLLETYGDLAYQLGRTIGAPWVAILVQMRYEDGTSECGRNNFWGNGCPVGTPPGGASVQGENLGEGFAQYGQTLTKICSAVGITDPSCQEQFKVSDPKKYLELIGPFWVQGDPNGGGYWFIEDAKNSIDSLLSYIDTPEGQSIVKSFTNYAGMNYDEGSSSSSSPSSAPSSTPSSSTPASSDSTPSSGDSASSEDGSNVTIIGDSMTQYDLEFYGGFIKQKFPNADIHYQNGKSFVEYEGDNPGGLTILKQLADQGKLRKKLVFALGSNNGGMYQLSQSDIDKLLDYAKDCDKIVLLTNYKSTDDDFFDTNNSLFKAAASSNDKVVVADWEAEASKDPDKYIAAEGDFGIHPTKEGAELRANLIANALGGTDCVDTGTYKGDYPQYNQWEEPWKSIAYGCTDDAGNPVDFSWCGCGPAAMAMLATVATNKSPEVTPQDVVDLTKDSGYYWDTIGSGMVNLDKIVGDKYGFSVESVGTNGNYDDIINAMREKLKDGYMIHLSGGGSSCPFPKGPHYIGIFDIDNDDNVRLADPGFTNQCPSTMKLSDVVKAGYHGDAFTAVKGGGLRCGNTNSSNGDKYCDESGGSGAGVSSGEIVTGGFTSASEAETKITDPFKADAAEMANGNMELWNKYNITGGTPYNCFSFSNYFISKYTSIDFHGVGGSGGGGYAKNFYNAYHDAYPNLKMSNTPTAYSVAGCGDEEYIDGVTVYSHTFIVVGINKEKGTMIYSEAALGYGEDGITSNEVGLTDPAWASRNGSGDIPCTYTDFSAYLKGT